MPTSLLRLNKFISQTGLASRRQADRLIAAGQVEVNRQTAHLGQRINPHLDQVTVNGQLATLSNLAYYAVNKPPGYVTTLSDPHQRPIVTDLLPSNSPALHPIGRLDIQSEGLLILTNDGQLTHQLTHPSHQIYKTYHVYLKHPIKIKVINQLESGINLSDGRASVISVKPLASDLAQLEVVLDQGKHRQIRRMLGKYGLAVTRLIRSQIGSFSLEQLGQHQWIKLSPMQVRQLTHQPQIT